MEACCVLPIGLWVAALFGGFLLRLCCCLVRHPLPKIQHAALVFALTWLICLATLFVNTISMHDIFGWAARGYASNPGLASVRTLGVGVNLLWAGMIAAFIYRWFFEMPLMKGMIVWIMQIGVGFVLYFGSGLLLSEIGY